MRSPPVAVGIVCSPDFGENLERLADQMPVWIVDTPINRVAAEHYRRTHRSEYPWGVTTFRPTDDLIDSALQILSVVVEHHGIYSLDAPVQTLEFVGIPANQMLLTTLAEYGFTVFEPSSGGFRITAA